MITKFVLRVASFLIICCTFIVCTNFHNCPILMFYKDNLFFLQYNMLENNNQDL